MGGGGGAGGEGVVCSIDSAIAIEASEAKEISYSGCGGG